MKILVYSAMNAETVLHNLGEPEYSYFFVLREFMPVLQQLGEVEIIDDPASEVDRRYHAALERGQQCAFLSFSPPHLTTLGLDCPTIPVFAWEFSSMPGETWWQDRPEMDWRWCLEQCAGAIVHSQQSAQAVRALMGDAFPVVDIPAPLQDRMAGARQWLSQMDRVAGEPIEISRGTLFDTHDSEMERWLPTEDDIIRAVAEARSVIPIDENKGYRRGPKTARRITLEHLVAWYQQVLGPRLPDALRRPLDLWAARTDPWQLGRRQLKLDGVVFTSLFNPHDGRKNWVDMVTAFCVEFRDQPDATLVLKLGHRRHEDALQGFLMLLPRLPRFRCRLVILNGFLADEAYLQLLGGTHFAVNTSYGEGQCLPLMEYMSCGRPAVSPCHSALADYIRPDNAFSVDSWADATAWPHDPRVAYRTLRQQVDWASLRRAYRAAFECYRNQPDRYRAMAQAAEQRMQQHCSQAVALRRLSALLQRVPAATSLAPAT